MCSRSIKHGKSVLTISLEKRESRQMEIVLPSKMKLSMNGQRIITIGMDREEEKKMKEAEERKKKAAEQKKVNEKKEEKPASEKEVQREEKKSEEKPQQKKKSNELEGQMNLFSMMEL